MPRSPAVSRIAGSTSRGHAEDLEQLRIPVGRAELGARRGRRIGRESGAQAGRRGTSRRCRSAGSRPRAPAPTASSCSSSHAILPAEKYGSSGIPLRRRISSSRPAASSRSRISWERLSCQVTIGVSGRPVSASHASTDSPWWSRPQASICSGRRSSDLARRPRRRRRAPRRGPARPSLDAGARAASRGGPRRPAAGRRRTAPP